MQSNSQAGLIPIDEPTADIELNLVPGGVKAAMRDAKSRDLWQVPVSEIKVMAGFNVRVKNADLEAHIRELANSIKEEGFHQDKPLAGYIAKEDGESVIYVYDGHCRLEAAKLAIAEGAEIDRLPVVTAPAGTSAEDLTLALFSSNSGRNLQPYELGILCKRLVGYGWDIDKIAARFNRTRNNIDDLLFLVAAPKGVRDLVMSGAVAASFAIETLRKHGSKALEVLLASLDKAKAAGKERATAKFAPDAAYKKAIKKAAPEMADTIRGLREDKGYASLSPTLREKIEALAEQIEEANFQSAA